MAKNKKDTTEDVQDVTEQVTEVEKSKEVVKETMVNEPIYKKVKQVNLDDQSLTESVLAAAAKHSDIIKYLEEVESIPKEDIDNGLTTEETLTIGINYESASKTPKDDTTYGVINAEEFVNAPKHNDKRIGVSSVNINATGKLSGSNAIAKFTTSLGIGRYITVTLWHSGFSLVLAPPKESEFINLQYAIAKAEQKLGYETNNFIYSNYGVVINKILVDFIMDHVQASSLDLPEGSSYADYIKITDLDTLAIACATSVRPSGYPMTMTCKNSLVLENDRPVCDFTATADVIPENLLWVNRKTLTPETLAHISKTSPGSHTVDDVLAYQNSLIVNDSTVTTIANEDGVDITFTIQTPTLRSYIDSGELWVNTIISNVEDLFTENDSPDTRDGKIAAMVATSSLNKYNSHVTSIKLDDTFVEDSGTISSLLEILSSSGLVGVKLHAAIIEHINNGYISLVAKYNFDCPKCKEAGREPGQFESSIKGFKEFIPMNAVENFFDLSALTFAKVVNRKS